MVDILVRNVADTTAAGLKKKAKAAGKSMNDIAREALDSAARPSKQETWAEADRIRARTRAKVGPTRNLVVSPVGLILLAGFG